MLEFGNFFEIYGLLVFCDYVCVQLVYIKATHPQLSKTLNFTLKIQGTEFESQLHLRGQTDHVLCIACKQ